jgi:hypothetical protein
MESCLITFPFSSKVSTLSWTRSISRLKELSFPKASGRGRPERQHFFQGFKAGIEIGAFFIHSVYNHAPGDVVFLNVFPNLLGFHFHAVLGIDDNQHAVRRTYNAPLISPTKSE